MNFRQMASNKHVDLRKTENFVRSKCYPEDISKDKGKKANFTKSCKNFKIADGHLTCKGKRIVTFGNHERETQHMSYMMDQETTQKLRFQQLTEDANQLAKNLLNDFTGIAWLNMERSISKTAKIVNSKKVSI